MKQCFHNEFLYEKLRGRLKLILYNKRFIIFLRFLLILRAPIKCAQKKKYINKTRI